MSLALLLLVPAILLLAILVRRDPLADIPGPWLARYSSLLLAYHARAGKRYLYIHALHKKYGPLVRITPTQVSCFHPDAPAVVYAQGSAALPKTPFYRAFYVDGTPSLFSTQDRQGHASKRRALAHPFSLSSVRQLEGWVRSTLAKFVQGLDNYCVGAGLGAETLGRAQGSRSSGGPFVDMLAWFNYMTFDVISDLAFGEPLGMVDRASDRIASDDELGVAAMIDYRGRTAAFLGLFPSILPPSPVATFIMWFLIRVLPDPFIRRGLNSTASLSKIARRCVKRRLEGGGELRRGDLLDKILDSQARNHQVVNEEDVVTEAMLLLTAGSDTTANSSAAILFHIIKTPRVYKNLMRELSQLTLEKGLDGHVLPSYDQVKDLKYLQATIDEALRMFATNAFGLPRVVPENTRVELCGKVFPAGTQLSAPAWSIQHDESIWGDPMVCRPERWLEDPSLKKYLLTFGLGPRACIGRNLAYMQMQLLIATVLTRYNFELRDDVLRSVEGFMHKPVDMWARISKREGVF